MADGGRVIEFPIPPRVVVRNPRPRRPNAAVRAECRRRLRASGLSAEAFTAAEGLRFATLQRWLRSAPRPDSGS